MRVRLHLRRKASQPMTAVMKVAPFAFCLALTLQACLSKELTTGSIAPPSPATWEAEAARLIRTLDLPAHLQESARDYTAKQMTRGTAPKPALEQWVAEQRDRGAMIRCRRRSVGYGRVHRTRDRVTSRRSPRARRSRWCRSPCIEAFSASAGCNHRHATTAAQTSSRCSSQD